MAKDKFKYVVGTAMLVSFLTIVYALAFQEIPASNKEVLHIAVGEIIGATLMMVGYYFGSSSDSREKTQLLAAKKDEKTVS